MREKSEGNIWTWILVDIYIPFQASICNASLAVPTTLVGFTAVISRVLLPAIPSFLRLDSITLFALQNENKIQLLTIKNWTVKCGLILFSRWFGLLQYVARYMLSVMSATTKLARLKKKNLFCLPDLLVAILSLFQHNNRMQNSRIFLVFLLSFLSFFLSFFSLRRGEGGGEGHECEKVSNEHGLLLDITFVWDPRTEGLHCSPGNWNPVRQRNCNNKRKS